MIQAIQKIQSILWLQAAKHTENSFQKIVSRKFDTVEVTKAQIGFRNIGEVYALNGKRAEATQAYDKAQRSFEAANRDAKDMLNFQDFRQELNERRKELR